MTQIESARRLTMAFLSCTACRAVPLDLDGLPCLTVERGADSVLFRFVADEAGSAAAGPALGAGVFAVSWFADAQVILERLGWCPSVLE